MLLYKRHIYKGYPFGKKVLIKNCVIKLKKNQQIPNISSHRSLVCFYILLARRNAIFPFSLFFILSFVCQECNLCCYSRRPPVLNKLLLFSNTSLWLYAQACMLLSDLAHLFCGRTSKILFLLSFFFSSFCEEREKECFPAQNQQMWFNSFFLSCQAISDNDHVFFIMNGGGLILHYVK